MDKRTEAKAYRGVWYDARIDRFGAEIYINGRKQYLGMFRTAEGAGAAYEQAARDRPPRETGPTFAEVVEMQGPPGPGNVVEFRGQEYEFVSTQFRRLNGRSFPFFEWRSKCCVCGEEYETLVSAGGARSVTRKCLLHRKTNTPRPVDLSADVASYELLHGPVPKKFSEAEEFLAFLRAQRPGKWKTDRDVWAAYVLRLK